MLNLIEMGGPVMWLLAGCGLVAGLIFFERLLHLHRAQINAGDFLQGICNILRRDNIVEAVSICEETPGPIAYLVRAAVLHHSEPRGNMEQAIREAGLHEVPRLERNLNLLLTLAQICPLIGLLGTVLGMINSLVSIEQGSPLVHAGDVSHGLWLALITSAAGLAIAIPAYAGYNFLLGRVEAIVLDMERAAGEILAFLAKRQAEEAS